MNNPKLPDLNFKQEQCQVCGRINEYLGKKRKACHSCRGVFENRIDIAYWVAPKGKYLIQHNQEIKRLKTLAEYSEERRLHYLQINKEKKDISGKN